MAFEPPAIPEEQGEFLDFFGFEPSPVQPFPILTRPAPITETPESSGRKKALLIGINYPGTQAELRGCINDVTIIGDYLVANGFEYSPTNMVKLVDDSPVPELLPTKANILKGIQWLVAGASPGDTLFFHYSGHGAQQMDSSGREGDGINETLCPMDFNKPNYGGGLITDDTLWDELCAPLPPGVKLIAIFDCCHSGSGLDLSYRFEGEACITAPNPNYSLGDVIMFSGCKDDQTSADAWSEIMAMPAGALTTSFVNTSTRNPGVSFVEFMDLLREDISSRGFTQIPQLSSSQVWDATARTFDFDNFVGNSNEVWGKQTNQHFKPQKPNMQYSPIGIMLLEVGFAVLLAPELMGAFERAFNPEDEEEPEDGEIPEIEIPDFIKEQAAAALEGAGEFAEGAMEAVGEAAAAVGEFAVEAAEATADFAVDAAEAAGELAGDAWEAAGEAAEAVGEFAGEAAEAAGELAGEAWEAAGEAAEAVGEFAGEAAEAAGELAGDAWDAAGDAAEAAGEFAGDALDAAGDLAEDAMEAAEDAVEDIQERFDDEEEEVEEPDEEGDDGY